MKKAEITKLSEHVGHDVSVVDFVPDENVELTEPGRICLECVDCNEIILGERVMVHA